MGHTYMLGCISVCSIEQEEEEEEEKQHNMHRLSCLFDAMSDTCSTN